ncbi:MAG: site-specific integrase [Lachnospiraceae bacterium]|nr:site-specific integrase [Lachnospiraceae bacterium]
MTDRKTGQLNNVMDSVHPEDLLEFLFENDIISLSGVQEQIAEMNLEKFIRETHSHKIWKGKDGRWRTYIPDDGASKKRRMVVKSSKKKLLDFLVEFQKEQEFQEALAFRIEVPEFSSFNTVREIYPIWLEHKRLMVAETTIPRIEADWMKYYEHNPLVDMPIGSLNKILLESWVMHLIRDNEMTKKTFYNVSLIMRQIFQYAYDAEIIEKNPFDRVKKDLGKFFRKVRKPADETQVYLDEEIAALEKLIWADFAVEGRKVYRLAPLAVLFQLYTGMRVSEVCAVKYEDVLPDGKLYIQRMLVRDTGQIRERTKGYAGERIIYLPEKAKQIIQATRDFRKEHGITCEEFIFSTTEVPFPESVINDYLERYCSRLDIPYRSSHKLRKTAVSSMVNAGISLNAVREFAGHVDETTTLRYYTFDRENEAIRNEQIEKALSFGSDRPVFEKV